jgi:hypothetical protein
MLKLNPLPALLVVLLVRGEAETAILLTGQVIT